MDRARLVSHAVVFEAFGREHRAAARRHLRRGRTVYYRRAVDDWADDAGLAACVTDGRVRPLVLDPPLLAGHNEAADLALEAMDAVWERLAGAPAVKRVARLYNDETIHLAFKKLVLQRLAAFFATDLLARRVAETLGGRPLLVTEHAVAAYEDGWWRRRLAGVRGVAAAPACRLSTTQRVAGRAWAVAKALGARALVLYGLTGCVVRTLQCRRATQPLRRFAVGVTVINTLRQLANDVRGVDFIVDGHYVRREETALVSARRPTPDEDRKFRARGLAVCVVERAFDAATLGRVLRDALALLAPGQGHRWLVAGAWHLVEDHALWTTFASRYRIGTLVTHADHSFRHVSRTLVLRRAGTQSWYYIDSWNYNNLYATTTGTPYRHWLWAYLCYDVLVSWNRTIVEYFRAHRQHVGRYVAVGCLWAEHVRLIREGALAPEAPARLRADLGPGQRLVAVFPAWYQDGSVIPPEAGLAFIDDVRRLLDEFPELVVVVKEKHPRWFFVRHPDRHVARAFGGPRGARIYEAYDALERDPRCRFPGHALSASELIAAADLVISDPFTSTTYEALASGVKGLYHDAGGRHHGAFYDRIPGLVTHDYAGLAARVRELLHETTPEDYFDYLTKHFVGVLEPDLEGRALTRFRALLAGHEPADVDVWTDTTERRP
jgi:hypothetical protein